MGNVALIRADGSKAIGMGHLNRAALVAGILKTRLGLSATVLMRKDAAGEQFARSRGLNVAVFNAQTVKEEIEFLQVVAFQESPVLFILDVLENDTDAFYMNCLHKFDAPIVAITDDSLRRVIDADLVVNGNPAQISLDYSGNGGKYLLGPKYFLMDEGYKGIQHRQPAETVRTLLVTLGGSDHNDLLFKLLNVLKEVRQSFALVLVVSSASGYIDRLKNFLNDYPFKCNLYVDAPTLVPFWQQADAAITAGGNTLFERIAARVPGATLCQLPRQNEIAYCFEKLGVNKNLGFGPQIADEELKKRIELFLEDAPSRLTQYERAPQYVDGQGLKRFAQELESILKGARS